MAKINSTSLATPDATERLKSLLRDRALSPGDRLPGERELAETLGISRGALRESLRILEGLGLLETRHGAGTSVVRSGVHLLDEPMEFLLLFDSFTFRDLIEAREAIEVYLAPRAALRRTPEDLAELESSLRDMEATDMSGPEGGAAHRRFHNAIAQAAHSPLLARFLSALLQKRSEYVQVHRLTPPGYVVAHDQHRALVHAIQHGDAEAARIAMEDEMSRARAGYAQAESQPSLFHE